MDWAVQVLSLSRGTRIFLLQKDSDQFSGLSILLFSAYRQLFPGIQLSGREAKHSPLLSGLYCAMCLYGRSGTTSCCFTKMPIKQCHQLYLVLALAELEVAKRASLTGRFAPWEEPRYLLQTGKLRVDCREERIVNCSRLSVSDGPENVSDVKSVRPFSCVCMVLFSGDSNQVPHK